MVIKMLMRSLVIVISCVFSLDASDVSRCDVESELVMSSTTSMSVASTCAHLPMSTSLITTPEQTTSHTETTSGSTAPVSFEGSTSEQTTAHPLDTSGSITPGSLTSSTTKQTTSHQVLTSYSTTPVSSEDSIEQTTSHPMTTSDFTSLVSYTGSSPEQITTSGSTTTVSSLSSITEQTTSFPMTSKDSTTQLAHTVPVSEQTTPTSVTVTTFGQMISHPVTISDSTTLVGSTVSNSRQTSSHSVTTLNSKTTVTSTSSLSTHLAATSNFTISGSSEFSSMTLVMPTSVPSTSSNSAFSPSDNLSVANYATKIYIWPCLCNIYNKTTNLTSEQWTEWMREINTVTVKSTSRYRRTLTSAEDRRVSAVSVGNVAIGILVTITAMVVLTDALNIVWKRRLKCNRPNETM